MFKSVPPALAHTYLFVPADRPDRYQKAFASGAHCVIIDLEDAVNPDAKHIAREAANVFFALGGNALLRINALNSEWIAEDLALCAHLGVAGVILPKAQSSQCIATLRQNIRNTLPILPLIETAQGMLNVREIAAAPSVLRLLFGSVDFCVDLNLADDFDTLAPYRASIVLASRAASLEAPMDGISTTLHDLSVISKDASDAKRVGFGGKLCIHPSQVATVNACFQVSSQQMVWAKQVLELAKFNAGAFQYEGKMVDAPVLALARRCLNFTPTHPQ